MHVRRWHINFSSAPLWRPEIAGTPSGRTPFVLPGVQSKIRKMSGAFSSGFLELQGRKRGLFRKGSFTEEISTYFTDLWILSKCWPSPSAEMCRGFLLYKFWRICRGFSWRIFLGTFSHKNEEKKSGDKIRKKIRRLKNKNPRKIRSAKVRHQEMIGFSLRLRVLGAF